jgi:HK97 family phage portal protein
MLNRLFGIGYRGTAENPSVPLSEATDIWDHSGSSSAGVSVSGRSALTYSPFWQAVSMISGDVAGLPLEVFKRDEKNGRRPDRKHPAYRLLARKSNEEASAFLFWRQMLTHLTIWNRGYVWIRRDPDTFRPLELLPLLPDRTGAERVANPADPRRSSVVYVSEIGGKLYPFSPFDVLHFRGLHIDATEPCELVEKARDSIGLGLAAIGFGSKFFKHGARVSGVVTYPKRLTETNASKVASSFNDKFAGQENAARVLVMSEGAKFQQTTLAQNEAQYTELRTEQVRDMARFFNMDPQKLGAAGGVSYNSLEQANKAYLQSCLMPWLNTVRWECWDKLLTEQQKRSDSHIIEHNTKALLATDAKTRAEAHRIYREIGVESANDVARAENMPPLGEGGDVLYVPANWQPAVAGWDAAAAPVTQDNSGPPAAAEERGENHTAGHADPPAAAVRLGSVADVPITLEEIQALADSLRGQYPGAAVISRPDPAALTIHRDLVADALRRMGRRLATHARRASDKGVAAWCCWLEEFESQHGEVIHRALAPPVAACGALLGVGVATAVAATGAMEAELLAAVRGQLEALTDTITPDQLSPAVSETMADWESTAAAELAGSVWRHLEEG